MCFQENMIEKYVSRKLFVYNSKIMEQNIFAMNYVVDYAFYFELIWS